MKFSFQPKRLLVAYRQRVAAQTGAWQVISAAKPSQCDVAYASIGATPFTNTNEKAAFPTAVCNMPLSPFAFPFVLVDYSLHLCRITSS